MRPLARTLLGEALVLFRQSDGKPAALVDRCAHRNMALSRGQVRDGCLECPYHGWRYAGDGSCVLVPSLAEPAGVPASISVAAHPSISSDGYVWVYMGDGRPAAPPPRLPHKGEAGWTTFTMANRFEASAYACLENFLDCPHTVFVHRGLFRSPGAKPVRARLSCSATEVTAEFSEERDAQSLVSRLLFPKGRPMLHTDRFCMPTTSRVDYSFGEDRHFMISSHCTPVSEHLTDVYTVITFRFGRVAPLVRLFFEPLSWRIIRQDLEVLRAQTENLKRFGSARFTSLGSDLIGPQILRLWRESLRRGAAEPAAAGGERAWEKDVVLRF